LYITHVQKQNKAYLDIKVLPFIII
jgi:hypothetical protein